MITIFKEYTIGSSETTNPPTWIDYTFSSSKPCVNIVATPNSTLDTKNTDLTGRINSTSGKVTVIFELENEDCFTDLVITLARTDSNSNTASTTFSLTNPCTSFDVSISNANTHSLLFTATVSGGSGEYSYEWLYDNKIFDQQPNGSQLQLSIKDGTDIIIPDTTELVVITTDLSTGCTATDTLLYQFCKPTLENKTFTLGCASGLTNTRVSYATNFATVKGCSTTGIDWSSLVITSATSGLEFSHDSTTTGEFTTYAISTLTAGTYTATATVKTNQGIESDEATFTIIVPDCSSIPQYPTIQHQTNRIQDTTPSTTYYFTIDDKIQGITNDELDWSTFTFVATSGQTLVSATSLTATNGAATLELDRRVKYVVAGSISEEVDVIKFKVSTTSGQVSNIGNIYVDTEATSAPSVTGDSVTTTCGSTFTVTPLSNDTGDLDPGSVVISTAFNRGSAVVNNDGTITGTVDDDAITNGTIGYKVSNTDGIQSAEGTITVTITCAGTGSTYEICPDEVVDLTSLVSGESTGGVWAADAGNPSSPSIASPNAVTFGSGLNRGTYLFTYTVGGNSSTVTIIYPNNGVTINSISTPASNSFTTGNPKSTVTFTTVGVLDVNEISINVTGPTAQNDDFDPDTWNGSVGTVLVDYSDGAGSYTVTVTVKNDKCLDMYSDNESVTVS